MQLLHFFLRGLLRGPADDKTFCVRLAGLRDDVEVDVGDLLVGNPAIVLRGAHQKVVLGKPRSVYAPGEGCSSQPLEPTQSSSLLGEPQ